MTSLWGAASILSACASRNPVSPDSDIQAFVAMAPQASPEVSSSSVSADPSDQTVGRLAAGDLIGLSSLEDKKLNGAYRLDFDGGLSLPYEVHIPKAAGLTLNDLSAKIREAYKPFFAGGRVALQVTLKQHRVWLDVRGLVQKPGKVLVDSRAGIDEVLALAGGFVVGSHVDEVRITRGSEARTVALADFFGNGASVPDWRGGEQLFFRPADGRNQFFDPAQSARSVQFLGEVRHPGLLVYRPGATFLDYLAQAEGPTALADLSHIEIVRGKAPAAKSIFVDFRDQNRIPMPAPGDVVILYADKPTGLERAMPIVTGLSALAGTVLLFIIAL